MIDTLPDEYHPDYFYLAQQLIDARRAELAHPNRNKSQMVATYLPSPHIAVDEIIWMMNPFDDDANPPLPIGEARERLADSSVPTGAVSIPALKTNSEYDQLVERYGKPPKGCMWDERLR
jgi:hypothetical protein